MLTFGLVVAVIFALFQVRDTSAGDIAVGAVVAAVLQALVTGGYLLCLRFGQRPASGDAGDADPAEDPAGRARAGAGPAGRPLTP